jgi:pimeloyl-ACP methyl ester carboxylesterase
VHEVPAFQGKGSAGWDALVEGTLAAVAAHLEPGGMLVGHSLGGMLAFLAAARRPPHMARLALLEPAIAPWRSLARRAAAAYGRDVQGRDRDRFVNWTGTFRRVVDPARFPPQAIELYLAVRRSADPAVVGGLLEGLESLYPLPFACVDVPVLLLRGEASGWRARLGASLLGRRLTDARLRTVPRAGHWLMHDADPAVAKLLRDFSG